MMDTSALQDFYRSAYPMCRIGPGNFLSAKAAHARDRVHDLELLLERRCAIHVINEAQRS
jgi:hypothetical protein